MAARDDVECAHPTRVVDDDVFAPPDPRTLAHCGKAWRSVAHARLLTRGCLPYYRQEQNQTISRMKRQLQQLEAENRSLLESASKPSKAAPDARKTDLESRLKSANAAIKREKNSVAELTSQNIKLTQRARELNEALAAAKVAQTKAEAAARASKCESRARTVLCTSTCCIPATHAQCPSCSSHPEQPARAR